MSHRRCSCRSVSHMAHSCLAPSAAKLADYAAQFRTPVALHNVGSLVLTYANAHFGASIQNFYHSESQLGRPGRHIEGMAAGSPPDVGQGLLTVPTAPGRGWEINRNFLKKTLGRGEGYGGGGGKPFGKPGQGSGAGGR